MANHSTTYDVFLSHSASDAPLAAELAKVCRASGLETMTVWDLPAGVDLGDAVWQALTESRALLVILSPSGPTPSMGIEIGAAQAWNKPIFAILTDASLVRLPSFLADIKAYPPTRIGDIIEAIKRSGQQLSEEDRSHLAEVYGEIGVSVDQLALDSKRLQKLVKRFSMRAGRTVSGEQLLSELLRMRKQGALRRNRSSGRSEPHPKTA
jgi:hypothetical protein